MRTSVWTVKLAGAALWATGCTQAVRQVDLINQSGSKEVFAEVTDSSTGTEKVDLIVRLSIKTHPAGFYPFEPEDSLSGKPGYPLIVPIDGQSVVWREDDWMETTPKHDRGRNRTPEEGEGRRYVFNKRVRLAPGLHRIEVDLPEESYTHKLDLVLEERLEPYIPELQPVYKLPGRRQSRTFLRGLNTLQTFLDGCSSTNRMRNGT